MKRLLIALIRLYRRTLSPFIGQQCRFEPTCSHYGEEAIARHITDPLAYPALRSVVQRWL